MNRMTASEAIERAHQVCPCVNGQHQAFCVGDLGWEGLSICLCAPNLKHQKAPLNQACRWPGHAAIDAAIVAAFEAGQDYANAVVDAGIHLPVPLPSWLPTRKETHG